MPSGLWHASIFRENRPGQSEVRVGREPAGLPAGVGRGCSVGRLAPSSTRLPPSGRLSFKQARLTCGKHSESLGTPTIRLWRPLPFSKPALERAIPFGIRSRPAGHAPTLWQGNSRCHPLPAGKAGALPPAGRTASASTPRVISSRHPAEGALPPHPCLPGPKGLRCACGLLSERR